MPNENDALDAAIRRRSRTRQPVIDTLNTTVPQADPKRRAALEERLIDRLQDGDMTPGRKPHMNYAPTVRAGVNMPPRRLRFSSSALLFAAVGLLCAAAVIFFSFNLSPQEDVLHIVAPPEQGQEQPVVLPSATETLTSTPTSTMELTRTSTETPTLTATPTLTSTPTFSGTMIGAGSAGITVVTMTPTRTPFVDAPETLFPQSNMSANRDVAPPNVWFPAGSHISAADDGGVIVVIDPNRLIETDMGPALTAGQTGVINLFTVVGVPPDQTIGAVGEGGDLAFSYVSVAAGAQLLNVNDLGYLMVQVTLEQGIVLNWLVGDTNAPLYYERAQ